jgi:hypothetical protein
MRTPEYRVLACGNAGNDDTNAQDGGDRLGLAEARISAEELRIWGNRELTRAIRESTR